MAKGTQVGQLGQQHVVNFDVPWRFVLLCSLLPYFCVLLVMTVSLAKPYERRYTGPASSNKSPGQELDSCPGALAPDLSDDLAK